MKDWFRRLRQGWREGCEEARLAKEAHHRARDNYYRNRY